MTSRMGIPMLNSGQPTDHLEGDHFSTYDYQTSPPNMHNRPVSMTTESGAPVRVDFGHLLGGSTKPPLQTLIEKVSDNDTSNGNVNLDTSNVQQNDIVLQAMNFAGIDNSNDDDANVNETQEDLLDFA